jgi:hypothetical protein
MVIDGRKFSARWMFDDDRMLDYVLEETAHVEPGGRRPAEGN